MVITGYVLSGYVLSLQYACMHDRVYIQRLFSADCGVPGPVFGHTAIKYNSTLEGSMSEFWCQRINGTLLAVCLNNGEWSPKPSDNMLCSKPGGMIPIYVCNMWDLDLLY